MVGAGEGSAGSRKQRYRWCYHRLTLIVKRAAGCQSICYPANPALCALGAQITGYHSSNQVQVYRNFEF